VLGVFGGGVDDQVVGHYGLGVRNDRGERLVDFCKKYVNS
jgi:hypothetical protein